MAGPAGRRPGNLPEDVQRLLSGGSPVAETLGTDADQYYIDLLYSREYGQELPDGSFQEAEEPGIMADFYYWATNNNLNADPNDASSVRSFFEDRIARARALFDEERARANRGGGGRTLFPQEAELLRQQALSEEFQRSFSAATARVGALQSADMERRARIEGMLSSLLQAAPYAVGPEDQYFPGLEPGGVGERLGTLLGARIGPREIPRTNLPVSMLMEAPLASPEEINRLLTGVV